MIQEEYCTFDTCKLLKEAGYPQTADYINVPAEYLANPVRPTQAQAMRWLREKGGEKIHINIYTSDQVVGLWNYQIERLDVDPDMNYDTGGWYTSYEAAAEAGTGICNATQQRTFRTTRCFNRKFKPK